MPARTTGERTGVATSGGEVGCEWEEESVSEIVSLEVVSFAYLHRAAWATRYVSCASCRTGSLDLIVPSYSLMWDLAKLLIDNGGTIVAINTGSSLGLIS